jgi:uncharacterized membrane protein YkvA (DUF1232 family)
MESFMSFLSTILVCMTLLGLTFIIVLSLPQSRMREVVKKGLMAIACAIYVLSPIDLMPELVLGPFGLIDDGAAFITAIISARDAYRMAT